MFQGLDTGAKPSSRVLRPPGGGSSNLFGGYEEDTTPRRPNKMASSVFASAEEPQHVPRRSNPPGGKSSGIFGDPEPPARQQKPIPPGGPSSSNIFGAADTTTPVQSPSRCHPNKPKVSDCLNKAYKHDNLNVGPEPESPAPEPKVSQSEVKVVKAEATPPAAEPAKEETPVPPVPETTSNASTTIDEASLKNHEPHLGPRPRSHNKVINPPGGKSSVVFY